ncbi:RHS repeat-associated core domain-containing protein [Micromonospora sp. NPDC047620]|uniref:RHS repeat-associated core domain-containing protein n=1 Tax=Micromonospora sp. NPDC047620 TaxID=3364251 RepID=UPI00371A05D6
MRTRRVPPGDWARLRAALLAGLVLVPLAVAVPAHAAPDDRWNPPRPDRGRSVQGGAPAAWAKTLPDRTAQHAVTTSPKVSWPEAGSAEVDLTGEGTGLARLADGRSPRIRAGALPVWVGQVAEAAKAKQAGAPSRVLVEVHDRGAADRAGVAGLLMRVERRDGQTRTGEVTLDVDYAAFAGAYGGDYAARLRLVRLPACVLTTPRLPACQRATPLPTRNNLQARRLSAQVTVEPAGADATILAVTANDDSSAGDWTATPLAPSASWQAGASTGDFTWSYPMRTPEVAGDLVPKLALGYSSGSVDGRIAQTNNQTSWVGEGFDFWPGYIERSYKGCADDMGSGASNTTRTGDLCWGYDNAVMVLGGRATQLIRDDTTGVWRPKADDGSRVEKLTSAATANGDNDGEHWRVTTVDGTQYHFGLNRLPGWASGKAETNSTWAAPVFGNHSGEPCRGSTFATSWCQQAWRWNLDYVVDPHGNAMTYWYGRETNHYGRNVTASSGTPYHRGGHLTRIDYGLRSNALFGTAPARVVLTVAERCLPDSTFDCAESKLNSANARYWPDVPFDRNCNAGATCTNNFSPTFWSRKRLTGVTTQVWDTAAVAFRDVDTWALRHQLLKPGDGTSPALWLAGITHTGRAGGSEALPELVFHGTQLVNRVDALEGIAPMIKWRISAIVSEAGGTTSVTYSATDCVRGQTPVPDANTKRCFPSYWTPDGAANPTVDWFHKYLATQVVVDDRDPASPDLVTRYEYLDGAAWHHDDDDGLTKEKYKTWSQWRGYGRVRVTSGADGEQRSQTETRYFRGMDGDRLAAGGTKDVKVTDSRGVRVDDHRALAGLARETISFDGPGGAEVSSTVTDGWIKGNAPTARMVRPWGTLEAFMTDTAASRTRTALAGGERVTETKYAYNADGLVTEASDLGDTGTAADDRCTRTWYARNATAWLLDAVSREETVSAACTATPAYPGDLISDERTYYDDAQAPHGTPPSKGDVVKVEELAGWSGGQPQYLTTERTSYDSHGRPLDSYDVLGKLTTTRYTPATGGPVTAVTVTNPLGHVTTTQLEPAWGAPKTVTDPNNKVTTAAYDPLGRLTKVWLPGRSMSLGPNTEFDYAVSSTGPSVVTTKTLRNDGSYATGYALFDGLLRARQTQSPALGGGRLITDTGYDSRGQVVRSNATYHATGAPATTVWQVADNQVPSQTVTVYDGAGRQTASILRSYGVEKWRTTTTYGGDRTSLDPPDGGTATTTVVDARGRTVELHQYHGGSPTGPADVTRYAYDHADRLASVTDPAGNTWTYGYDLRGRRTSMSDPDRGATTLAYDDAGRLVSTTDARGRTVATTYDDLGRKTSLRDGSATGPKVAEWVYDTLTNGKGQLTSSTRWAGGNAYVSAVVGYDDRYRPTATRVTIPASEGVLAGTYQVSQRYNLDGTVQSTTYPAAGGLPAEGVLRHYNELGLPTTVSSTLGVSYLTETAYTLLNQPLWHVLSTGTKRAQRTYAYDATSRLVRAQVDREANPSKVADVNYTYDPAGNVTRIADTPAGGTADVQCFAYDYLRRMTEAWTATDDCAGAPATGVGAAVGGPDPYWHSYTFDKVGNRLTETRHDTGGDPAKDVRRAYSYPEAGKPGAHRLSGVVTTGPGAGTDSYTYDATGNTTRRQVGGADQTLTWDAEGHVASVAEAGKVTEFVYDADGNRLIRRDPAAVTVYLGETELRLDRSVGTVSGTRYVDVGGGTAVRTSDGRVTFQFADHHGTNTLSFDPVTAATTARKSMPYGGPRGAQPSSWAGEKGFVGGTLDSSTGLTHLGAREYDPMVGRFISVDPIMDLTNPQQMHGYSYSNANPVTFSDPTGLLPGWLEKSGQFIWENAGLISAGLFVASLVTPVGWLGLAGFAFGVLDTGKSCIELKGSDCFIGVLSTAFGGAGALISKLTKPTITAAKVAKAELEAADDAVRAAFNPGKFSQNYHSDVSRYSAEMAEMQAKRQAAAEEWSNLDELARESKAFVRSVETTYNLPMGVWSTSWEGCKLFSKPNGLCKDSLDETLMPLYTPSIIKPPNSRLKPRFHSIAMRTFRPVRAPSPSWRRSGRPSSSSGSGSSGLTRRELHNIGCHPNCVSGPM